MKGSAMSQIVLDAEAGQVDLIAPAHGMFSLGLSAVTNRKLRAVVFLQWLPTSAPDRANLISAIFGMTGTVILFLSSYVLEPFQGGVFGSKEVYDWNDRVRSRNRRRKIIQKIGLAFLCLSFVVQFVAVLYPCAINVVWPT